MRIDQVAVNAISTKQVELERTLAAYAAAGFENVEFPLFMVRQWMGSTRTAADARKLLGQHKLKMIGGFEHSLVCFGDAQQTKENHALQIANAKLIAELGEGGVLVVGTDGPKERSLEALETIGQTMARLVEQMPPSVSLAVEFNWSPIVKSLKAAQRVAAAANHSRVGILFDPAHYYCTASKLNDLTAAAVAKIIHVHVNDMRDKPGDLSHCNSDRVLPGQGVVGLPELLGRLEGNGYKGLFSLEMFNEDLWKLEPEESAGMCYRSMKGLCG